MEILNEDQIEKLPIEEIEGLIKSLKSQESLSSGEYQYLDALKEELITKKEIRVIEEENETDEFNEELPTFQEFKANNFGRPTKYLEDMPERLFNYFMKPRIAKKYKKSTYHGREINKVYYEAEEIRTVEGFCVQEMIHRDTFYDWLQKNPDFSDTYELCKKRQKTVIIQNVLDGEWGLQAGSLVALNYTDMRLQEKKDDISGSVESTPIRNKGYDLGAIDEYCGDDIDAEYKEV